MQDHLGTQTIGGVTGEYFGGNYKLSSYLMGSSGAAQVGVRVEKVLYKNLAGYLEAGSTQISGMPTNNSLYGGFKVYTDGTPSYTAPKK